MSQSSRQFWINFSASAIPIVVGLGVWLWQSGGHTAVHSERLAAVEKRVADTVTTDRMQSVEHRVGVLEISDRNKTELLAEIRADLKWLVRQAATEGRNK